MNTNIENIEEMYNLSEENSTDEMYMRRCFQLALQGLGNVAPNPLVGSVIVYKGKIIGEGFHREYGQAHAEVNAVNSVQNKELLKESTIYVNLEPCSHYGKTPPCAELLVRHNFKRVVICNTDPFPAVSGRGIAMLRNAGLQVSQGLLENEGWEINKRFFTFHQLQRPYILLKWAQSADGFLDSERNTNEKPVWLTNSFSKILVHKWRSEEQAILVGTSTILKDNPQLNTREYFGNSPLRISFNLSGRLTSNYEIFNNQAPSFIIGKKVENLPENSSCEFIELEQNENSIDKLMKILFQKKILSIMVEGGSALLNSFLERNLWDEARVFTGNSFLGSGVKAPHLSCKTAKQEFASDAQLNFYYKTYLMPPKPTHE